MSDVYIAVVCRINKTCAGKYTSRGTSEELRESQDECNSQFSIVFFITVIISLHLFLFIFIFIHVVLTI